MEPAVETVRIVVASPSDVQAERDSLATIIEDLNRGVAVMAGLRIELSRWETDAFPGFHAEGPQGLIDSVLRIEECDLLVGIFWKRFGTPTTDGTTGTEHEFRTAYAAWQKQDRPQIMVYFNQKAYSPTSVAETDQWGQVLRFKGDFPKQGLWWPYSGKTQFERLVRGHLTNWIRQRASLSDTAQASARTQAKSSEKASNDAARDKYLTYLLKCHTYMDPRGIMQTERSATLPLSEVYVSLMAEREREWTPLGPGGLEDLGSDRDRGLLLAREVRTEPMDLARAVRTSARMVVLGDPGAGKTTLARFLTLQFAQACNSGASVVWDDENNEYGETRLPILFRVAEYADAFHDDQSLSLRAFLPRAFGDVAVLSEDLSRLLCDALDNGKAFVILDGLDEVIDAGNRARIARRIDQFVAGAHPANRFLVTSRIVGYREARLGGEFAQFTLRDLERDQIERFLNRWCLAYERFRTPDADAADIERRASAERQGILQSVDENPGVQRLARNPLLLTILALIHRNGARLPSRRVELYQLASVTLLRDWRLAQVGSSAKVVEETEALRLLGPLAYWMHENEPTGLISERDARERLAAILAESRKRDPDDPEIEDAVNDFLRRVREHTGLFVERAPGRYGFMHLTFEEYFAGRDLVRRSREAAERIYRHRHQTRWEEPIRLAIAFESKDRPEDASDLIRTAILGQGDDLEKFRPSEHEDILHRDLLFAASCLGDCASADPTLVQQVIGELVQLYLDEGQEDRFGFNSALRERIAGVLRALVRSGIGDEAIRLLLTALDSDENSSVRAYAAEALGSIGQTLPEVSSALLNTLISKQDLLVRGFSAAALGTLGKASPEVIAALLNTLTSDKEPYARRYAAEALAKLGQASAEVLAALLNALTDKGDWLLPAFAATALGRLGQVAPEVISVLLNALTSDQEWNTRVLAATALGSVGHASPKVTSMLLNAFTSDKESNVRASAATALGSIGQAPPEVITALLNVLTSKEDMFVRGNAAAALGSIGQASPEVITALLNALTSEQDLYMRRNAALALGSIGQASSEVITALLNALNSDNESTVRAGATEALGKLGQASSQVVTALLNALTSEQDLLVRAYAATALDRLGQDVPEVLSALLRVLKDENEHPLLLSMAWEAFWNLCQKATDEEKP